GSSGLPLVYIAASKEDRECARKLQKVAVACKGAARIMEDQDPGKDLREVKYAGAVIFVYGNAQRQFVDYWLRKYFPMKRQTRKDRIEAIYRAPPSKSNAADDFNMDWHGLRKCGSHDELKVQCMRDILAELHGNGGCCRECRK